MTFPFKVEFETHRKTPEIVRWHPDYAGSGYWARSLLRRISASWKVLFDAFWLPAISLADEAKAQIEPLISALEDYIAKVCLPTASSHGFIMCAHYVC